MFRLSVKKNSMKGKEKKERKYIYLIFFEFEQLHYNQIKEKIIQKKATEKLQTICQKNNITCCTFITFNNPIQAFFENGSILFQFKHA